MSEEIMDLEADSKEINTSDEGLKRIATLAKQQVDLQAQISDLEDLMKELGEQLKKVQEYDLPEAMSELGITEFKTDTGHKISVKPYYSGKIDDTNREQAFDWLRKEGHEDLIKHELTVALGRGEDSKSKNLKETLKAMGMSFMDKEGVHHSTLNAFIKEQVEGGADFPLDTFKAYIGRKTKITIK